jgi:multicomponent Na+:H+ antiporter subunit F
MTLPTLMLTVIAPVLMLAIVLSLIRLVRGPSIADRVIALDLLTTIAIGIIAAISIATDQAAFIDIALLVAVLGFLATIAFAYYIERRA